MFLVLALNASCSEYPHSNLWDPDATVQIEILGPDTTYSRGEVATFTYRTTPEWPNVAPVWSSSEPGAFQSVGGGAFRVGEFGLLESSDVVLQLGPHFQRRRVVHRQRLTQFTFGGCQLSSVCYRFGGVGASQWISVVLKDAEGQVLADRFALGIRLNFETRRPEVIRIAQTLERAVQLQAVSNGSGYVVVSAGDVVDSLLISVEQIPTSLSMNSACYEDFGINRPRVGESVQLQVASVLDANGTSMGYVPEHTWHLESVGGAPFTVSVTATGLVTAQSVGSTWVVARMTDRPSVVGRCFFTVEANP